jgi:DnaK suppressor protein
MPAKAKAKTKAKTSSTGEATTTSTAKADKTKAASKAKAKADTGSAKAPSAKTTSKAKTPSAASKAKTEDGEKSRPVARDSSRATKNSGNFTNFEPYQLKRNEDYMNEAQRKHFSHILFAWKAELMEEVDRTVSHMKDEAANFPDPADRATQEEEFSLELRTRDRERKLIKKIESTLELIDQDEYGYCNSCGVEIGIKRLEARPTANLCIDCKTLDEIREKQQRG